VRRDSEEEGQLGETVRRDSEEEEEEGQLGETVRRESEEETVRRDS
jgi:hypothetical protein